MMGFCRPSLWDEEAGGSQWGQHGLHSKTLEILPCLLFHFSSLSMQHSSCRILAAMSYVLSDVLCHRADTKGSVFC